MININSFGERVYTHGMTAEEFRAAGELTKAVTTLEHGEYDYTTIDTFVINRYSTSYNIGGSSSLQTINDTFFRLFPYFNLKPTERKRK